MESPQTPMAEFESEKSPGFPLPTVLPPTSTTVQENNTIPFDDMDLEALLVEAARTGEIDQVGWLLARGADINAYPFEAADRRGVSMAGNGRMIHEMFSREPDDWVLPDEKGSRTALQAAAGAGQHRVVDFLLGAGADINSPASKMNGRTALQAAAETGQIDLITTLLHRGAVIDAEAGWYNGRTALQAAAGSGNLVVLLHLLDAGANINAAPGLIRGRTALQAAAESGFEDGVDRLVSKGAEINGKVSDYLGRTALQAAAQYGHERVVQKLEQVNKLAGHALNVHEPAAYYAGRTALQAAAESGNVALVQSLLNLGASVDEAPAFWSGKMALEAAAQTGNWDLVQTLIGAGAGRHELALARALTAAAKSGNQDVVVALLNLGANPRAGALHAAAGGGHSEVVALFLSFRPDKADLDLESEHGRTAIEMAARGGYHRIVKQLIDAGANVNANPRNWRTPLQAAAEGGDESTVRILLDAGASINAPPGNFFGRTALQAAAEGGHYEVVKMLLDGGADRNALAANVNGKTALQAATEGGFLEVLKLLVDSGALISSTDRSRRTCLHRAIEYQQLAVLDYLLTQVSQGILDANFQDYGGMTALHLAAEGNYATGVRRLLRAGADTDIEDNRGRTPLDIALQCESINTVSKLLIEKGADLRRYSMQFLRKVFGISKDKVFQISEDVAGRRIDSIAKDYVNYHFQGPKLPQAKHLFSAFGLGSDVELQEILCPPVLHMGPMEEKRKSFENQAVVRWFWVVLDHAEEFGEGIPNPRTKMMTESVKGILSCYVSFKCFVPKFDERTPQDAQQIELGTNNNFETRMQKSDISWCMWRNDNTLNPETNYTSAATQSAKHVFRSMDFRSTLPHGWVPSHGVDFFTLFILDLYDKWTHVVLRAEHHLARSRQNVLLQKGGDPLLIDSLLKDAQKWDDFQELLGLHVRKAKVLAAMFKDESVLYEEVKAWEMEYYGDNAEGGDAKNELERDAKDGEVGDPKKGEAMAPKNGEGIALKHLEEKIAKLKDDIEKHILSLNVTTQELIKLQFSLVSIYEAQASTSTAMSMKRLSWITFVFLPLLFVASLFGMNVNLVENNPDWWWYIVISGPVFAIVILAWLIFKYLPIEAWIENGAGESLQKWSKSLSRRLKQSRLRNRKRKHDQEAGSDLSSEYITRASSLTHRATDLLGPSLAHTGKRNWLRPKKKRT